MNTPQPDMDGAGLPLAAFWARHKDECMSLGQVMRADRENRVPGTAIEQRPHGDVVVVTDPGAVLAAIRRKSA